MCLYNVGTVLVKPNRMVYFLQQRKNLVISACKLLLIFFYFWDGVRLSPLVLWQTVATLNNLPV